MIHHNNNHKHEDAAGSPDELATCVVMNIPVKRTDAEARRLTRAYNGQTYYLCCNGCAEMFDEDPQKYAATSG